MGGAVVDVVGGVVVVTATATTVSDSSSATGALNSSVKTGSWPRSSDKRVSPRDPIANPTITIAAITERSYQRRSGGRTGPVMGSRLMPPPEKNVNDG